MKTRGSQPEYGAVLEPRRTRLAPSPTGALHLGNARSFVIAWLIARKSRWGITLRIEDLDGPRIKPGAAQGVVGTLAWLGLDWDEGPLVQSTDLGPYQEALVALARAGKAFPSDLTLRQVEDASSAPQEGGHEVRFAPELRPELRPREVEDLATNWRFATPKGVVVFDDRVLRPARREVNVADSAGDFIVWTKRGTPAYQLAVVVDDHRQGITDVIRGNDLEESAARQLMLYRALGYAAEPCYWHLGLVVGPDGRRLAKRHGDTRVEAYRERGVRPEAILGWVAASAGVLGRPEPMSLRDLLAAWPVGWPDVGRRGWEGEAARLVFQPEVDRWLLSTVRGG